MENLHSSTLSWHWKPCTKLQCHHVRQTTLLCHPWKSTIKSWLPVVGGGMAEGERLKWKILARVQWNPTPTFYIRRTVKIAHEPIPDGRICCCCFYLTPVFTFSLSMETVSRVYFRELSWCNFHLILPLCEARSLFLSSATLHFVCTIDCRRLM